MKLIKRNSEVDLPITANSIYCKELMKEHFVRLVFDWDSDNLLEVGDYIIWEGVKYTLLKPYLPDEIEIGWYRYSVDFQAEEMLWTQKYFVYKDVGRKPETEWNMIADASTWLKTVVDAILLETGKSVNYFASNLLDGTQGIEIDNISIFAGLNKIADAFNTEWWYDDKGIHLGRYEEGEVVELVVGGNVNPPRIEQDQEYFTRIIPLGSERNIPQNVDAKFVNYKNRLKLDETKYPNGYIDIEELPIERIVPKTVIFDDIYPRAYLKISEVKSEYDKVEQQYVFSVKLKDYTLDKDDILENQTPILAFTGGLLNGRNFEINVGEWLTLINQDSGGIIVPNEVLAPEVGDSVILWNIKIPDKYIKDAQDELEEEAIRYIAKNKQDLRTYSVATDATRFNDNLSVGSKVKLINGERELTTRVISIEYYLDTPSKATFTIGNNRIKGFMDKLLEEAEIDKIKEQLSKGAKDGTSVVIKGKVDSTDNLPDNPSKGDSYWVGAYLYTWNGVSWVVQDLQGESGSSPYIKDGYWWIDDENTGTKAEGETPYIGINGNWWIGDEDTGIGSKGESGAITYMAGLYSNTKTYKATSLTRPLVFQPDNDAVPTVGKYYYPKEKGDYTGISPKDNPDVWGEAEQFEMILTNTLVANFAKIGAAVFYGDYMMSQEGVDSQGRPSTNFEQFPDNFTPNFMVNYKTGFVSALEGIFKGHIDAYKGTIGGFEIADGRIGFSDRIYDPSLNNGSGGWRPIEPSDDVPTSSKYSLSITKDFFRVGGNNGYAMLGENVVPLTAGGAFTAVGRIVNNKPNKGGFGYDNANYGLFIDVTGGEKNYGIHSNAPLLAPAFIGTRVSEWNLNGSSYKIDFSQASVYVMRRRTGTVEVTMPPMESVAQSFGYTKLPEGFGFVFTVVMLDTSTGGKVILKNLYDRNQNLDNFSFTKGDNATIMAYVQFGELNYHLLSYNT